MTPVHIGTGEDADPFSYVIHPVSQPKNASLHYVDLVQWIQDSENPKRLADIFEKNSFSFVRKYIHEHLDTKIYSVGSAHVTNPMIVKEYESKLDSEDARNQLLISPGLKNSLTGNLLIHGSSVKGAIRTAVIDFLDLKYKFGLREQSRDNKSYRSALEKLLGPIRENSFKALKLWDFEAVPEDARIVSAEEKRRKDDRPGTPKSHCEVTRSVIMDLDPYSLCSRIGIGHPQRPDDSILEVNQGRIHEKFDLADLAKICCEFYQSRYRKERDKFYKEHHFDDTAKALAAIEKDILTQDNNCFVLRIGHYSHVECVTVTNNQPQTRTGKQGTPIPHGTTRTLANGIYPFGWVKLSLITEDEFRIFLDTRIQRTETVLKNREECRFSIQKDREKEKVREEKAAREEQERIEAEAKRQAELTKMSPEERDIAAVRDPATSENKVMEIYSRIDNFPDDMKGKLAQALKDLWEEKGKWNVKKKKKQWVKVQKIKAILGNT
ncbi:MAG: hypothetical protein IMF11_04230 [Proteobacteria bacterium]|nr:hypothetical protein [Pseudomonadota bacterium]